VCVSPLQGPMDEHEKKQAPVRCPRSRQQSQRQPRPRPTPLGGLDRNMFLFSRRPRPKQDWDKCYSGASWMEIKRMKHAYDRCHSSFFLFFIKKEKLVQGHTCELAVAPERRRRWRSTGCLQPARVHASGTQAASPSAAWPAGWGTTLQPQPAGAGAGR
jgi:hypothetical protein